MEYKLDKPVKGSIGPEKYRCTIEWRGGKIIADESIFIGGKDAGPDPMSLLLSSIASSILIMLRIYIDNKGWDIPEITVRINMYEEMEEGIIINIIDRDLVINTHVSEEIKSQLLEIAKHCPITNILTGNIKTRTFIFRDSDTPNHVNYTNGEVTIEWKPEYCQHSLRCWKQLPHVFNPKQKKWITMEGATSEEIIQQVRRCPSGALTYFRNETKNNSN